MGPANRAQGAIVAAGWLQHLQEELLVAGLLLLVAGAAAAPEAAGLNALAVLDHAVGSGEVDMKVQADHTAVSRHCSFGLQVLVGAAHRLLQTSGCMVVLSSIHVLSSHAMLYTSAPTYWLTPPETAPGPGQEPPVLARPSEHSDA